MKRNITPQNVLDTCYTALRTSIPHISGPRFDDCLSLAVEEALRRIDQAPDDLPAESLLSGVAYRLRQRAPELIGRVTRMGYGLPQARSVEALEDRQDEDEGPVGEVLTSDAGNRDLSDAHEAMRRVLTIEERLAVAIWSMRASMRRTETRRDAAGRVTGSVRVASDPVWGTWQQVAEMLLVSGVAELRPAAEEDGEIALRSDSMTWSVAIRVADLEPAIRALMSLSRRSRTSRERLATRAIEKASAAVTERAPCAA